MADVPLAFMKLAAITGISLVWANLTLKAFKLGWHIAFFSLEQKEKNVSIAVCEKCQQHFLDDGEVLADKKLLCQDCRN